MTIKASNYPTIRPSLDLNFAQTKRLDPRITYSRSSSGTYFDSTGTLQSAANNEARFDHDPTTGESLGLLVEEAGTNYIDESVNLTDTGTWSNYKFLTPTLNAGTSPDGTTTATSLVPNTENVNRTFSCNNIATTFQGTLTVSVFAKANGYNKFKLFIDGTSAGGLFGGNATFDLSTGTVTQGASGVGTITELPNGWYRCAVTHTNTAQAFTVSPGIQGLDNSGNTHWAGDGTSGYLFWGFQLEASPYPTSYIPTSGSTVTRAADVAQITGSNFSSWYNQSEGTVYCNFLAPTRGTGASSYQVVSINDGTVNEHIGLFRSFDPVQINANIVTGYSTQASFNIYPIPVGSQKVALSYKSDYSNLAASGTLSSADTNLIVPNPTQLSIGQNSQYTAYGLNSTISRLTYYPVRLADSVLQTITS